MPIFMVISEAVTVRYLARTVQIIHHVVACTLDEFDFVCDTYAVPLEKMGCDVHVDVYVRAKSQLFWEEK